MPGIPLALQPVAHSILQALEDAELLTSDLETAELWTTVGGAASIGFHLRHAAGSLDRLMTYARGEALSAEQRRALAAEKESAPGMGKGELLSELREVSDRAFAQLRSTPEDDLTVPRSVGRAGYPSTVLGLLYHAGEHTTRHLGQVSTTARILRGLRSSGDAITS